MKILLVLHPYWRLMKVWIALLLCTFTITATAQKQIIQASYPKNYFRNPLDIPIFLAGNFGECRPSHFHSGVDIKTLGRENQPVHAAADGYISRIKMEKGGFGHGIYITHPNGYTTLYAHLNDFAPAIQAYVRKQQYLQKHWDVDLIIPPSLFPVKKGQQIAWSGNTGASTAPHLHFEIRDTKTEHPLNPELFGLPIVDHIPPVPTEVAFYNLHESIYEQSPSIIPVKKKGKEYQPLKPAVIHLPSAKVGVGINVNDFMNGSDNTIAFYCANLYLDDSLQSQITLDDIGYDETRYINAYADYKTHELHGSWIQCFFKLPGNHLDRIYSYNNGDNGAITLLDNKKHHIRIDIIDDQGNKSVVSLLVQADAGTGAASAECNRFSVNKPNSFNTPNVSFSLDDKELYDDICFVEKATPYHDAFSDRYQLHEAYVPLHHYFDLKIKPNKPIPFSLRDKIALMYSDGKETSGKGAPAIEDGWYTVPERNFGAYWLAADTVAPVIRSLQKENADLSKTKQITFMVKDSMTSVKIFSGLLDGQWICFEQHGDLFFYRFDEHCPPGRHTLEFSATDDNNNTSTYRLTFTR